MSDYFTPQDEGFLTMTDEEFFDLDPAGLYDGDYTDQELPDLGDAPEWFLLNSQSGEES